MEGTRVDQDGLPQVHFYVDDRAITGMDANLVQWSLDVIIEAFKCTGVRVNHKKTKWMYVAGVKQANLHPTWSIL